MDEHELEDLAFEFSVDFTFTSGRPSFGDLFLIVGYENPNFPPGANEFQRLDSLGFEQVDDYFGIPNPEGGGDDVSVWLYPVVDGEAVHHHPGPFDALRLDFCVVRNEVKNVPIFERCIEAFVTKLEVRPTREGEPISLTEVKKLLVQIVEYCRNTLEIEPGSDEALQLDY